MSGGGHAALMDRVYRRQRYIYDATRKYYLLGRDRLIADLAPAPGDRVLEVGCGTGRNLVLAAQRYPDARFFGLDISAQMLEMAERKVARLGLGDRITLAQGDATAFTTEALFGQQGVERAFFSYSLSMIPDWRAALQRAIEATLPEGRLHIVDFGQQAAMPGAARTALRYWLSLFHVDPQADMADGVAEVATAAGRPVAFRPMYRDYSWTFAVGPASRSE